MKQMRKYDSSIASSQWHSVILCSWSTRWFLFHFKGLSLDRWFYMNSRSTVMPLVDGLELLSDFDLWIEYWVFSLDIRGVLDNFQQCQWPLSTPSDRLLFKVIKCYPPNNLIRRASRLTQMKVWYMVSILSRVDRVGLQKYDDDKQTQGTHPPSPVWETGGESGPITSLLDRGRLVPVFHSPFLKRLQKVSVLDL